MQDNDLIMRADARDLINTWGRFENEDIRMDLLHNDLNALPAVDAVPVEHGRWEFCGDDDIVCSQCGARYFKKRLMYAYYTGPGSDPMDGFWHCPHCGALLDGGEPTCGHDYCEIGGGDE